MYEHVGPKVTSLQDGKVYKMAKRDYTWLMISRYNFKASVTSGSSIVLFTFFTPNGDVLTGKDYTQLITEGPSAQNESKELAGGNEMISSKAGPTGLLSKEVRRHRCLQHLLSRSQAARTPSLPGFESGNKQPPKELERANEPDNKSFKRALFPDEQ
ncbi:hypothetical protein Tco_0212031 [Tanacetum coccineum]